MLTLHYNGYDIPTGKDFSVRLSWKNPACFFSEIPGSAGLGIDIPVNDFSKAIFGSPHRFEKYGTGSDRKFSGVDIRFNGVLLMSGTLNITNATSLTYSAWLQSQVGIIGEEQREKYIDELQMTGESVPWDNYSEQTFSNTGNYDDDTDDYCSGELYNRRFWEEIGRKTTDKEEFYNDEGELDTREIELTVLSLFHRDDFFYKVNLTFGGVVKNEGDGCVVSPFLFLKFVLTEILKRCQFFIDPDNNAFTDELSDFKNLAFYNNYNIMQPSFTTTTEDVYKEDIVTGEQILVSWKDVTSIEWVMAQFDYIRLLPRVTVRDFLIGLQNMLNIIFQFRNDNHVNIIDRETIINSDAFDLDNYFLDEWIIGERKDLSLKFISEYDKDDSILSDNYHDLSERRDDFGDDVLIEEDLEDIASPNYGEIRHVLLGDKFFEYKWDVEAQPNKLKVDVEFDKIGWSFVSTGPQPQFSGDGDEIEEIKTIISTPYTHTNNTISVLQKGVINYTRTLWNNFSPRLFFYVGGNSIATQTLDGTYSLNWYGENGLLAKRWKYWAAFWRNRLPVEGDFDLPLNIIYYVMNNITSKFKTVHGEFIIEEMEVEFGMNQIGKTHIKGYKI